MREREIRKWLMCIVVVCALLSSFLFIPSGQESLDVPVYGTMDVTDAKITAPRAVEPLDCNPPKNHMIVRGGEGHSVAAGEVGGERYLLSRFLTLVCLLLLFLDCSYRIILRQFGRYKITLWYPVSYIHRSDGKKKTAFCNE